MRENDKPELYDRPEQLLRMGLDLIALKKGHLAFELARKALAACPGDPLIRNIAATIFAKKIPTFHAGMLKDRLRNTAFRLAIEAVAANRSVFDIGTGSGLLAMMAARAGAKHVYACEENPQLAATAREIISANGYAKKITVIAKHSTKLDKESDLAGGADLVIGEIFGPNLLSEQALPSFAHVREKLCKPNALFIPQAGTIKVALAEFKELSPGLDEVEGFDLSLFNRHVANELCVSCNSPSLSLRSSSADLFHFDYAASNLAVESSTLKLAATGGTVNGIVQWLRLDVGSSAATNARYCYENLPGSDKSKHWDAIFYRLERPVQTVPGDVITVQGWRTETSLHIWSIANEK